MTLKKFITTVIGVPILIILLAGWSFKSEGESSCKDGVTTVTMSFANTEPTVNADGSAKTAQDLAPLSMKATPRPILGHTFKTMTVAAGLSVSWSLTVDGNVAAGTDIIDMVWTDGHVGTDHTNPVPYKATVNCVPPTTTTVPPTTTTTVPPTTTTTTVPPTTTTTVPPTTPTTTVPPTTTTTVPPTAIFKASE